MAQSNIADVLQLTQSWADKTKQVLESQLRQKGIGITEELFNSLSFRVFQQAGDIIQFDLSFMQRGRFRDMGAGRERKVETMETNRKIAGGRKPAKWYSRPFYGRLNALQGAVGFKVMEQAIDSVIQPLQDGTQRR